MMNKPRVLSRVMMLLCFAALLQIRSQPLWAAATGGERAVASPGPARPMTATALGVTMISVGWYYADAHTCAVTTAGGAKCWGLNANGELGNNSTANSNIPVDVNGLASGVTVIAAGQGHSCAVASGAAKCWGDNSYGQLGDGSTTESHVPVAVTGLASGVLQVATGPYHSCALTSGGGVKCWGRNTFGQLGNNSTTDSHSPVDVNGLASGVAAIAAGISHTCALLSGGTVKCWGYNGSGQLGDGTTTDSHIPVLVSGLTGATAVATGGSHSCALTNAGQAKCWGNNYFGQLGDGSTTESHVPVLVSALSGVTALDAGDSHTCAVASGGAKCWGWNIYGQLGNNSLANSSVPVDVAGLGSGVSQIAAGTANSCAVMSGGGAKCWGENYAGELGSGELWTQSTPVTVSGLGGEIVAVGTGYTHSCAVTSSGGVKCWGDNHLYGELGNNSTAYSATAVDVNGLSSGVAAVSVNQMYACALTSGGGVKCWGYNGDGQLGNNSTTDSPVPVNVSGLNSGVQAIAAGAHHACALMSGGGVKCWGSDYFGQLGDGSTTNSPIPVDVSSLTGVTALSAGGNHTCAVASGGAVKCWGRNANGQLGNNSTANSSVPVDVSGLGSGATAIAAGAAHTCAVASGGAKCWGYNYYGQLGNGSTTESHIPVNVNGLGSGIAKTAAGFAHSCALTSGGVKCWGDNWYGELGNNSTTNSSIPVDVSGLASGVNSIAAGSSTNCVVVGPIGGRTVQCWGDGYYGQLGNGKFGYRVSPVNVSGLLGQLSLYLPTIYR